MPIFAASVFVCLRFCSIRLDTDCYVCWSSPTLFWGGRRLRWAEGVLTKRPIRGWKAANDRPRAKNITVQKCLPRYRWAKTTTTTKVLCCRCCRAKKFFRICCLLFVVERSAGKWLRRLRDGVSHRVRALKKCGQADENLCEGGGSRPHQGKGASCAKGVPFPLSLSLSLSRCTTLDVNLRQGKFLESFLRSVTVFGVRRHRRRPFVGERRTVEVIFSCPSMSPTKRESALAAARRSRRIAANGRCSAVCRWRARTENCDRKVGKKRVMKRRKGGKRRKFWSYKADVFMTDQDVERKDIAGLRSLVETSPERLLPPWDPPWRPDSPNHRRVTSLPLIFSLPCCTVELFSRRRWRFVLVQLANKFSYCPSWTVSTILAFHKRYSLPPGSILDLISLYLRAPWLYTLSTLKDTLLPPTLLVNTSYQNTL